MKSVGVVNKMNQIKNEVKQVAEKRLGLVIGVHMLSLLAAAAFPEGRFLFWLPILLAVEGLIVFHLLRLWKRYKYQSKHYYTINMYWFLIGLNIFASLPILRLCYGTPYFWLILPLMIIVFLYAHFIREKILVLFVSPSKVKTLYRLPVLMRIFVVVSIFMLIFLQMKSFHPNFGLSIFVYFVSVGLLYIATPFSIPVDQIEQVKKENGFVEYSS